MSEHRLDLERRQRLGLVEAIWGEHKSAEQIIAIARDFQRAGELALVCLLYTSPSPRDA